MATLRDFFTTEAADYLAQLSAAVQQLDTGGGDANELHRQVRGLRGSAQMAREDRVYRAVLGLEAAARSVAVGMLKWTEDVSSRIRRTLEDVDALVKGGEADDVADSRLQRALDRWRDVGVDVPTQTAAPTGAAQVSEASKQFRQFAAHEVSGVINEMDVSMEALIADPRTRDPLKAILRRQRALLGSARLQEIGVVAEALRATEDMTKVIAKLNVPVKEEWMAVFRSAREVLKASVEPLQRGETPGPTPALSKLRTLRQELLDRYGEGEAVSVADASPPPAQPVRAPAAPQVAAPVLPTPVPAPENGIMPIDTLLYSGQRALNRALELQPEIERVAGDDPQAREKVSELFDLIRLGIT